MFIAVTTDFHLRTSTLPQVDVLAAKYGYMNYECIKYGHFTHLLCQIICIHDIFEVHIDQLLNRYLLRGTSVPILIDSILRLDHRV